MVRRAEEPLERRDVQLFKGDWTRLREILAPVRLSPTEFIRKLVRKTVLLAEARKQQETTHGGESIIEDSEGLVAEAVQSEPEADNR